jgi:hypothetical protein
MVSVFFTFIYVFCRVVCAAPLRLQTLVCKANAEEHEREGDFNR